MTNIVAVDNASRYIQENSNKLVSIISDNQFDLHIGRELGYIREQIRVNHNKMVERNAVHQGLTNVIDHTLLNCIELGISMGLSFNTQRDFLHLIPRWINGSGLECTLMIGYRGYKKIAADAGLFSRIDTQLVYENDVFEFHGVDKPVVHRVTSLSEKARGQLAGGYCVAKLKDSDTCITTVMSPEELQAVKTTATRGGKGFSPWSGPFASQMYLKTVIRRAWKDWEYNIELLGLSSNVMSKVKSIHTEEERIINQEENVQSHIEDHAPEYAQNNYAQG